MVRLGRAHQCGCSWRQSYPADLTRIRRKCRRNCMILRLEYTTAFRHRKQKSRGNHVPLSPAAAYITGSCVQVDGGTPNARNTWKLEPHNRSAPFEAFHRSKASRSFEKEAVNLSRAKATRARVNRTKRHNESFAVSAFVEIARRKEPFQTDQILSSKRSPDEQQAV